MTLKVILKVNGKFQFSVTESDLLWLKIAGQGFAYR